MTEKTSLENESPPSCLGAAISPSLRFSERDVDFAYLCGVFNVSGIDGLNKEIQRLKEIGKAPHNIIDGSGSGVMPANFWITANKML